MYVRLAFAVAAHLEPEILIVDEVLAVGDAEFQKKCLGKMGEVAKGGRTVLFVSHNMAAVQMLCSVAVLLRGGEATMLGATAEVVDEYVQSRLQLAKQMLLPRADRKGNGAARLARVEIRDNLERQTSRLVVGRAAHLIFEIDRPMTGMRCLFTVYDEHGCAVARFDSARCSPLDAWDATKEAQRYVCDIESVLLRPGRYYVNVALGSPAGIEDHVEAAITFDVEPGLVGGRPVSQEDCGITFMPHRWSVSDRPASDAVARDAEAGAACLP
jgi:lipopolysaccharide transport system ATP-binding protein